MPSWPHDTKIQLIALIEHGGQNYQQAAANLGVPRQTARRWWQQYQIQGDVRRRPGSGGLRVSTPQQDAALVDEARTDPFQTSSQLVAALQFPGCSRTARRRLREVGLFARRAAVKEKLTEDHRIDRMAFADSHLQEDWNNVIFSDEKTFSSCNDGPQIVYRPTDTRYDPKYVAEKSGSGRFSVNVWGWISARGGGTIWNIDGKLTGPQYRDILDDVMLPSVRVLYPNGPIRFQHVSTDLDFVILHK